ncbi:porin family protein [bacterium]|jgi:hypothetical protein|nr:porin family protein [bacterium]
MKKLAAGVLVLAMSTVSLISAENTYVKVNTDTNVSSEPVMENTGKGFYMGAGVGSSYYDVTLTNTSYNFQTSTYTFKGSDVDKLDESDVGYVLYAGYQFNKIIAVEGAYTDYGSFSTTINGRDYAKKPRSFAVYANAGYTFLNGQLRPFGLLGLGYLRTYQSAAYNQFDAFEDSFVTAHVGFGVDYYPTTLKGFGFRASFTNDTYYDNKVKTYDNLDVETSTSLWQYYSLFYIGAQYKF